MKIFCVGDVCGDIGCRALLKLLPSFKKDNGIGFIVINGENSADGNGLTADSISNLYAAGANVVTGGNHSFRREESFDLLDRDPFLLRPHNIPDAPAGKGFCIVDCGREQVAVMNISGTVFMEKLGATSPFEAADELIEQADRAGAKIKIIDFHAEITSEKRALGFYVDSRVSAFFGTHTHVITGDAQVLPGGTGYITDIGMTGPLQSVLGVDKEIIIERLRSKNMQKFRLADGKCILNGCIFDIDKKNGKCISAESVTLFEERN